MLRVVLPLLILLAGCTRPLQPAEVGFLRNLYGEEIDVSRVRVHPGLVAVTRTAPIPPRVTCSSRLYPPRPGPTATGAAPAMTVFSTVLVRSDWHERDLTGGWPEVLDLDLAMLLAHEALHVWQWQNRDRTGYHPILAAREHVRIADPYLFDPATRAAFTDFGYEQQGAIVEEYLCCRLLAPNSERTHRLHAMLSRVLPVAPLSTPLARQVRLPWSGVELDGICD